MNSISNGYSSSSSSESCEHDESDGWPTRHSIVNRKHEHSAKPQPENSLLERSIVHLDVDCFYCQCEEIMNPSLSSRPFAVGQKHIIVTCNYIARDFGVKKLMLRDAAKEICPNLVIVEGSDLENYRKFSRKIYTTFRKAIKSLGIDRNGHVCDIAVKKGGMDEMFADISHLITQRLESKDGFCEKNNNFPPNSFVFGNQNNSFSVSISEDQSGSKVDIKPKKFVNFTDMSYYNEQTPFAMINSRSREDCVRRLQIGSCIASEIHEKIHLELGFTTCLGVSVSPMLAKIASDLNKPNSVNVLLPWRSWDIVKVMPLRRVPDLGSRTLKKLIPCLEEYKTKESPSGSRFWTSSDLLNVPHNIIVSVLAECTGSVERAEERCQLLLNRCKGIDSSQIVDDDGGLTKTVSVEDSFIRGSVTEIKSVRSSLDTLATRLMRLLDERKINSDQENLAYPTTVRLAVRLVDESIKGRRPFSTQASQKKFDGETFSKIPSLIEKKSYLVRKLDSLLVNLLLQDGNNMNKHFDVTKLNIAALNFKDLAEKRKRHHTNGAASVDFKKQKTVNKYFIRKNDVMDIKPIANKREFIEEGEISRHSLIGNKVPRHVVRNGSVNQYSKSMMYFSTINKISSPESYVEPLKKNAYNSVKNEDQKQSVHDKIQPQQKNFDTTKNERNICLEDFISPKNISAIDPDVLNALPPDIKSEISRHGVRLTSVKEPPKEIRKKGIEKYFTKTK